MHCYHKVVKNHRDRFWFAAIKPKPFLWLNPTPVVDSITFFASFLHNVSRTQLQCCFLGVMEPSVLIGWSGLWAELRCRQLPLSVSPVLSLWKLSNPFTPDEHTQSEHGPLTSHRTSWTGRAAVSCQLCSGTFTWQTTSCQHRSIFTVHLQTFWCLMSWYSAPLIIKCQRSRDSLVSIVLERRKEGGETKGFPQSSPFYSSTSGIPIDQLKAALQDFSLTLTWHFQTKGLQHILFSSRRKKM